MSIGKLTLIIGAGLIGSALSKEAGLSDVASFVTGALKFVTRNLQHDNGSSKSTSKPHTDSLLDQVNSLRQELQLLASSRSVTIVTGGGSGSGASRITVVIVVGAVGYGFIWWKGWKLSDMMFVTRRGFSDACKSVGKQVDLVSSSVSATKRFLSSRIDRVDNNVEEVKEITVATKDEVSKVHGELCYFNEDVESVRCAVQTLGTQLDIIEQKQDFATQGVYRLCKYVKQLEPSQNRNPLGLIQDLSSSSQGAIGPPQYTVVTRRSSMPPLSIEPPSSSASTSEALKVLHTPKTVSMSGLKDLHISGTYTERTPRTSSPKIFDATIVGLDPNSDSSSSSSNSSSGGFGWRLPGLSVLNRSRSTAS